MDEHPFMNSEEFQAMVKKRPAAEVAEVFGVSVSTVCRWRKKLGFSVHRKNNRWTPAVDWDDEKDSLLGTDKDEVIAKQLGCERFHVYTRRTKLGIPRYGFIKIQWDKTMEALLGTAPDSVVAKTLGIPSHRVYQQRVKLGIPSYKKTNKRNSSL